MVAPTQAEIDEAVMIAKNATYKLAYELALEQKYGGAIDCCVTKLKLLWMYERALECHLEYQNASATLELLTTAIGGTIDIFVNGETIIGPQTFPGVVLSSQMRVLAGLINDYQEDYVAIYDSTQGTNGKIVITGPDCTDFVLTNTLGGVGPPTTTIVNIAGVCADNCLTDEKAKKLIAKIKSMCKIN